MEEPGKQPDSLDAFLKELGKSKGIDVEHTTEEGLKQTNQYSVRVMFSKLADKYYLHSFIMGSVTENDFPGQLLKGQVTFDNKTLADVCEMFEQSFNLLEIYFHRDPPEGLLGPGHVKASYELVPPLNDPNSEMTLTRTVQLVQRVYSNYSRGLW